MNGVTTKKNDHSSIQAMNLLADMKHIKLFVLDVDGVLTDGMLLLLDDAQPVRRMNIKDGYAMQLAVKKGYEILIISGGHAEAVRVRLQKLGIRDVHLSVVNKKELLQKYMAEHRIEPAAVLYMGDDIPDVEPMKLAGIACCPADAAAEVKEISRYISPYGGGNGCVRDVIEKVLKLNNDWNDDMYVSSQ